MEPIACLAFIRKNNKSSDSKGDSFKGGRASSAYKQIFGSLEIMLTCGIWQQRSIPWGRNCQ